MQRRRQPLPAGEGQHLQGQALAALGGLAGHVDQALAAGLVGAGQQVQAGGDHRQQVVEVVRQAEAELAQRVDPLHLRQRLLRRPQLLLGGVALGDVAGDLGEAHVPALVPDRVDHDVGAEARAVLAHAPAFGLVAALARGGGQGPVRLAGGAVLGGVELREVLPEHLGVGIALDPFAAGVPAEDDARRVEHVDRIVGDPGQQQVLGIHREPHGGSAHARTASGRWRRLRLRRRSDRRWRPAGPRRSSARGGRGRPCGSRRSARCAAAECRSPCR